LVGKWFVTEKRKLPPSMSLNLPIIKLILYLDDLLLKNQKDSRNLGNNPIKKSFWINDLRNVGEKKFFAFI